MFKKKKLNYWGKSDYKRINSIIEELTLYLHEEIDLSYDSLLNYCRSLLGNNFHLSIKYIDSIKFKALLFYGADDLAYYFSEYSRCILSVKNENINDLVEFSVNYAKRKMFYDKWYKVVR